MLTQGYLKECFSYDEESGLLIWKSRPRRHFKTSNGFKSFNNRFAGKSAGCKSKASDKYYYNVYINNKKHKSHRVIWILMTGLEPDCIDHINGNGTDNSWLNLRNVTKSENSKNIRRQKSNTSGVSGVCFDKRKNMWRARLSSNNTRHHIGYFTNIGDAEMAVLKARQLLGFHENHGSNRNL